MPAPKHDFSALSVRYVVQCADLCFSGDCVIEEWACSSEEDARKLIADILSKAPWRHATLSVRSNTVHFPSAAAKLRARTYFDIPGYPTPEEFEAMKAQAP